MSESASLKKKKKSPISGAGAASSESRTADDDPKASDILRELADIKQQLQSMQATMLECMTTSGAKASSPSVPKTQAPPERKEAALTEQSKPLLETAKSMASEGDDAFSKEDLQFVLERAEHVQERERRIADIKRLGFGAYMRHKWDGTQAYTFKPGKMGIDYDERGVVQKVEKKTPADVRGIKPGAKIVKFALDGDAEQTYSQVALASAETGTSDYTVTFLVSGEEAEIALESVMGWVISVNAVYIGLAMDMEDKEEPIWLVINLIFSTIFVAELAFKIYVEGPKKFFSKGADVFDTCLVVADLVQLFLDSATDASENSDMPSASLFRLIRLAKLSRLLRLLRSEVFKDLLAMIQGMIGGMSTLMWAQVLFLLCVYVVALLFRELLGRDKVENVQEYFNAVPRSIFTTFRCSFGDCSAKGGVPIFEYVYDAYSGWMIVLYCLFTFATVVGLFNVVSAIFVETTMAAAMKLAKGKKEEKLRDMDIWSNNIAIVIRKIMEKLPEYDKDCDALAETDLLTEQLDAIREMNVPSYVIDNLIKEDPAIQEALFHLGVDPDDNEYLSDILDPDNGHTIGVSDLVDGIRRLRGEPKRSDIVTIDLMVRATQLKVDEMIHWMTVTDESAFHKKGNHVHEHHHDEPPETHLHLKHHVGNQPIGELKGAE